MVSLPFKARDAAQRQRITTSLRNLLRDYPLESFPKEMIQNADDAGATEVRFIMDRRHGGQESLLFPETKLWQGPCLWVYNDALFKDADWDGIQRLGEGSAKSGSIGRFGVGFNSVYNITDLPSVLSGSTLWLSDPHERYLQNPALPELGNRAGQLLPFGDADAEQWESFLRSYHDQFDIYQGVQGCDLHSQRFAGTLLRLPLRLSSSPASEIKPLGGQMDMDRLLETFFNDSHCLLLFLRNVRRVAFMEIKSTTPSREDLGLPWSDLWVSPKIHMITSVSLEPCKELGDHGQLVGINTQRTSPDSIEKNRHLYCRCWPAPASDARGSPGLAAALLDTDGCLSLSAGSDRCELGRAFCFLPLPKSAVTFGLIGVHVHAPFLVSQDRRSLRSDDDELEDPGSGQRTTARKLNEALLGDRIPLMLVELVDILLPLLHNPSSVFQIFPKLLSPGADQALKWTAGQVAENFYVQLLAKPRNLPTLGCATPRTIEWTGATAFLDLTHQGVRHEGNQLEVAHLCVEYGAHVIDTREAPHVIQGIESMSSGCHSICRLTPVWLRQWLRSHHIVPRKANDAVAYLEFASCDASEFDQLYDLNLLVTADEQVLPFQNVGNATHYIYVEFTHVNVIAGSWGNKLLINPAYLENEKVKGVLFAVAAQEIYQLRQLTVALLRSELNRFYEDDGCKRRYDALSQGDALWIQPLEHESDWALSWSTALVGFLKERALSREDVMKFVGSAVLSFVGDQDSCMAYHRIQDQPPFFFIPAEASHHLRNALIKHFGKYAIDASAATSSASKLSMTLCRTYELVRPSTVLGFLVALASLQEAQFDKVLLHMREQMTADDSRTLVRFILSEISLLGNHDKEKGIVNQLPLFQSVCSICLGPVSKQVAWISVSALRDRIPKQRAELWPADDEFTEALSLILRAGIGLPTLIGGPALDFDPPSRIGLSGESTSIAVGSLVRIHGLKSEQAQRYNDSKGKVIASNDSSMWTVELQGFTKVINVKETNLELVSTSPDKRCLNQATAKRGPTSQEHEQVLLCLGLQPANFGDLLQRYVLHLPQFLNSHLCIDIGFALLQKKCWSLLLVKDEECCKELLRVKMVEAEDGSIVEACSLLDPNNNSLQRVFSDMPGRKFPSARFRPLLQDLNILRTNLNKAELLDRLAWLQERSKQCATDEREVLQTVAVELRDFLFQLAPQIAQWSVESDIVRSKLHGPWLMPASRPKKDWPADMPWGGDSQESILHCGVDMWPYEKRYAIGAIIPTLCTRVDSAAGHAEQPALFKLCGVNTNVVPERDLLSQLEAFEIFYDEQHMRDGYSDELSFLRTCLFEHVYPALKHTNLPRLWIPLAASFQDVSKLALPQLDAGDAAANSCVDIPPFLFCVPVELRELTVVKQSVPNAEFSVEVCVQVLQTMAGRLLTPKDLDIALQLCKLCARSRNASAQEGLLVPTQRGDLARPSDCVYNNQPHLPCDTYMCHGRPWVHQCLMQDETNLPKALGVVPRTVLECDACLDASWIDDADAGQRELLTTRIKNILQQYPEGTTIMKELLQNADDAGGTRISFMFDWNQRLHNRTSCVTPELAELNGPCLWIYSDEKFKKEDWVSLKRLGVGGKREKQNMIGHFGLGFTSVYNFTDVPMILSGDKLLILDPHTRFLEGFVGSDMSGGCLLNWLPLLATFPDQLAPFHGIQGCKSRPDNAEPFEGTLMRLPFRSNQSMWMSQISPVVMSEPRADQMIQRLHEEAPQWLLFLNSITCIEVGLVPKLPAVQLVPVSGSENSRPKKHIHQTARDINVFSEEPIAHKTCISSSSELDEASEQLQSSDFECLLRCSKADNERKTQDKTLSKVLCFTQTIDIRRGESRRDRLKPLADWNTPPDGWKGRLTHAESLKYNVDLTNCGLPDPSNRRTVLLLPVEIGQSATDLLNGIRALRVSAVVMYLRRAGVGERQHAAGDRPQPATTRLNLEQDEIPVVQVQSESGEQLEKQLACGASITASFNSHDNFTSFECLKNTVKDSLASDTHADSKIVVVSREVRNDSMTSLSDTFVPNSTALAHQDDFTWLLASSSSCDAGETPVDIDNAQSALMLEQRAAPMEPYDIGGTGFAGQPQAAIALLLDVTSATKGRIICPRCLVEATARHECMSDKGLHTWCCYLPLDIMSEERMRFVVHANFALEQNRLGMVSKLHHESQVKRQEATWNRNLFCEWVHPLLCSCLRALGHPDIRNSMVAFNALPTDFLPTQKNIPIEIREVFCLQELYRSLANVPLFPQAALNSHEMEFVSYAGSCEPFDADGKLQKEDVSLILIESHKPFFWAEFNEFVRTHFYPVCQIDDYFTGICKEANVERPRPSIQEVAETLKSSPDLSAHHAVHALRFLCNEAMRSLASNGSEEDEIQNLVQLIMGTRVAVDTSESKDLQFLELRSLGSCDLYWPTPSRCESQRFAVFLRQFRQSADKLVCDSSHFSSWIRHYGDPCLRRVSVDFAPKHEIYGFLKKMLVQNPEAAAPLRVTLLDHPSHVAAAMRRVQDNLEQERTFWKIQEIMGGLRTSSADVSKSAGVTMPIPVGSSSASEPTFTSVDVFLPLWQALSHHIKSLSPSKRSDNELGVEQVKFFDGLPFIPSGDTVLALKGDKPLLLHSQSAKPIEQDRSFESILSKLGVHLQHMPESRLCRQVLSALQDAGYVQHINLSSVLQLLPEIDHVGSRAAELTCDEKKEFLQVMLEKIEELHRHDPSSMPDAEARGLVTFMSLPVWRPHSGQTYKKLSDLQLVRIPTLRDGASLLQSYQVVNALHSLINPEALGDCIFLYSGLSMSRSCKLDSQQQADLVLSRVGESDDTSTIQVETNLPVENGEEIRIGSVVSRIATTGDEQVFWSPESKERLAELCRATFLTRSSEIRDSTKPACHITFRSHPHYDMQALDSFLEIGQVKEHLGNRLLDCPRHMLDHVLPKLSERHVPRSVALDIVSKFFDIWDSQSLPINSLRFPTCVPDRLHGSSQLHRACDLYDPHDVLVQSLWTACPSLAEEFERRFPHASLCEGDALSKLRKLGLRRFSDNSQLSEASMVTGLLDCARLFELHAERIRLNDMVPGVGVVSRSQVVQDKFWELLLSLCNSMQREQLNELSSLKIFWCPQRVHHSVICPHSKEFSRHIWRSLNEVFPQNEAAFVWSIRPILPYSGDYKPPGKLLEMMQSVWNSNENINLGVIKEHLTKLNEISQQAFAIDSRHVDELQQESRLLVEALGRHMAKARTNGGFVELQAELKNKRFIIAKTFSSNHTFQQANSYELLPPKSFSVVLHENTGSRCAVPEYLQEIDGFATLLEDLGAGSGLDVSVEPPGVTSKFCVGLGLIGNKLETDPHRERHRGALEATSDVTLVSRDNSRYPAHKVLLALHNEYFYNMFCEPGFAVLGERPDVKIQEASGYALRFFLTALYKNEFPSLLEIVGSPEDRDLLTAAKEIFEFADMMCDSSLIASAKKEISEIIVPEFYYDTLRFLLPYDKHGQDLQQFILRQMASFRFDEAVQAQIRRLMNDEAMHALSLQFTDMLKDGAEEVE